MKKIVIILSCLTLFGCSATTLRCATDGESSQVELYNIPQNFSQNISAYKELCGFAYEGE